MTDRECDARPDLSRAPKSRQLHYKTVDSAKLDALRERPRTSDEHKGGNAQPGDLRDMIYRLGAPMGANGRSTHQTYGGQWTNVYYLYGDERRAIRVAILANEAYIDAAFSTDGPPVFAQGWPDQLYQLLCEEWECYRRTGELYIATDPQ